MMDAVTYPAEEVAGYIDEYFVAWRVNRETETRLLQRFHVNWTPTLVYLDHKGVEHYRTVGYLPPDVMLIYMKLVRAKTFFKTSKYAEAAQLFDAPARERPESEHAPEAIFFRGVALEKATDDSSHLEKTAEELQKRFPDSEWALRTLPR